ncbi:MAG TPA: glycosyltransferase family 4 protein [Pyrinomonadaceae bacterium]|nr:glycosyltransferase family 4 protein [Pyrinomonadaceae bacterium]
MKSVTMISWELDPFHTRGGTAYAIRRLADQLTEIGVETRVLLPDQIDTRPGKSVTPLLKPMLLKMPAEIHLATRGVQCSEFCSAALEAAEHIRTSAGSDAVIAHSLEGALSIVLRNGKRSREPSVFWLHSLYDPPISDFAKDHRRLMPCRTALASAVMMADIVVTSMGILRDAREFEWPDQLKELQQALTNAADEHRVLTVESMGCLPGVPKDLQKKIQSSNLEILKNVPSPYVLFPGRPSVDKGLGIFAAIAERLRADKIACVAVRRPARREKSENPSRNAPVHWLSWLSQDELVIAMRNAACTVLPSITEGFGLAAAESISLGVTTLYQQVGGHHGLQALPNALPVPLTTTERAHLYGLWSELFGADDYWSVWTRHEILLKPLVDKWVEAIRSVVYRADRARAGNEVTQFPEQPVEERWGNKLCRRIEVGTDEQNKAAVIN